MTVRIKICGITNLEDATLASDLGADYLGMIFVQSSPRSIKQEEAQSISQSKLRNRTQLVGVFKDAQLEVIEDAIKRFNLDLVQCHGSETAEFCRSLSRPAIKVIEIDAHNINVLPDQISYYEESAQNLLFDRPKQPAQPTDASKGSTPEDWLNQSIEALASISVGVPYFFAGGLNPNNIAMVVDRLSPFGVDVASGVESVPGKKDAAKLTEFIRIVKEKNAALGAQR